MAYNLFTQKPKRREGGLPQLDQDRRSTSRATTISGTTAPGEMLVFSAADFEDFRAARPDMPPEMEGELEEVVRRPGPQNKWPWRLHATYDETISRALDVFERVNRDMPLDRPALVLRSCRDDLGPSRSTASPRSAVASPCSTGWRIQGEYFVERYGREGRPGDAAGQASILEAGVQDVGRHRRDPRRVATIRGSRLLGSSPGKTVGGLRDLPPAQLSGSRDGVADVDRERDVVLERGGQERAGSRSANSPTSMVPDRDYFSCAEAEIADTTTAADRWSAGKVGLRRGRLLKAGETPPRRLPCRTGRRSARFGGRCAAWAGDKTKANEGNLAMKA